MNVDSPPPSPSDVGPDPEPHNECEGADCVEYDLGMPRMRRKGRIAASLGLLLLLTATSARASDYPDPQGYITDVANLLPPATRGSLATTLSSYEKSTSIEIAVLIIPSLGGVSSHDYADGLWKKWGIGKKNEDNGVLLLVVPPPEKIAWIQTGYGIQGWLTDVDCKHVVDDVMKPLNLAGKRPEAVVAGVDAIISKLGDTPWAQRPKKSAPKEDDTGVLILLAVIL